MINPTMETLIFRLSPKESNLIFEDYDDFK